MRLAPHVVVIAVVVCCRADARIVVDELRVHSGRPGILHAAHGPAGQPLPHFAMRSRQTCSAMTRAVHCLISSFDATKFTKFH
ncbi:hypothetical protein PRIPAC_86470 [Pristionchus pacificus]|uniref:Uncharacterized protein n=1 Tax=Pristionchus pacificus TaxID=54126 RepID=A0A2A6BKV7_PRIPA|nr:hypothetical protein PRIPAC_86470 [Pristionchus pacificus]|eukprot:PDM66478.1 hypothetical protein PRIPAC_47895 [Pristionchus pacificus]